MKQSTHNQLYFAKTTLIVGAKTWHMWVTVD